jgi:hypothetical protein
VSTVMKRRLLFVVFVTGVLLLAVAGWTVRGVRWTVGLPQPA